MLGIIFTPVGFFLILFGLWPALKTAAWKFLYSWGAALMVYLIICSKGNVIHEYYQLPFTPLGAVLMAIGARRVFREFSHEISITSHLILVAIIVVIAFPGWPSLRNNYKLNFSKLKAAEAVKRFTTDSVPIITIDGTNPVLLYYSDRKGWSFPQKHINNRGCGEYNCWDPMILDELSKQGAGYLVITLLGQYRLQSDLVIYVNSNWKLLKETNDFLLYER
jgi:hypothetical protein